MDGRIFVSFVVGVLVLGICACGDDETDADGEAVYELENEGAVCFGTSNPSAPGGSVVPGTTTTLVLYVDESMVSDVGAGFVGECSVNIDGDDIIIDSGVFVPEEGSEHFDEAMSPYAVECGEFTPEAKHYTVRIGETSYELDLSEVEPPGDMYPTDPHGISCVGLGDEIVEEDTAELCVHAKDDADENVELVATHVLGATSCIDAYNLECDLHEEGGEYSVSVVADYRDRSQIAQAECTADLTFFDVECGALELEEGSYEFSYGDEILEFDVPVEDETCVSP